MTSQGNVSTTNSSPPMNVVNSRLSDVTPACTSPDDSEETDVDDEEEPELLCTVKSDSSRYTLYKEKIGYSDFRTHREMELYLQALHGDREVVARISHFLPPAPKARTGSIDIDENRSSRPWLSDEAVESDEQKIRKYSDDTVDTIRIRERIQIVQPPKKHERVLGIGMEYPDSPAHPYIPPNTREIVASYIASVPIDKDDTPPPVVNKASKGKSKAIVNKISSWSLSKIPQKHKKTEQRPMQIEHVTYNASREYIRYIATTEDPEAEIRAYLPPVFKKYDAENSNREREIYEAQYSRLDLSEISSRSSHATSSRYVSPHATNSRYVSPSSSSRGSAGSGHGHQLMSSQEFTSSIGEFIPVDPGLPVAKSNLQRPSSDPIQDRVSPQEAQVPRRNTGGSDPQVLVGNPRDDHAIWFKTITEGDISCPTHEEMKEVLKDAVFVRPGWYIRGTQPGPDDYRRARDEEIRQIADSIVDDDMSIGGSGIGSAKSGSRKQSTSGSSDQANAKLSTLHSEVRPESRWSAYSDEDQPSHSWRQPMLWGTSKKKGTYPTESRRNSQATDSNPSLLESSHSTPSKFKLFGTNLLNRSRSRGMTSESNVSLMGGAGSSNESIMPLIDLTTYSEPHPGNRVASPPTLIARKVLKDAYTNKSPKAKEEKTGELRREELKKQIRKTDPTSVVGESQFWI